MKRKVLRKFMAFALCLSLASYGFSLFVPTAEAAGVATVYTFGNTEGPWPDLAEQHKKEIERRKQERRKVERKALLQEKAAMKKAARIAKDREKKEKAEQPTAA